MVCRKMIPIGIFFLFFIGATFASAAALSDIANSTDRTAIEYLQEKNIIKGYADGTFNPNGTINRAELLKILISSLDIAPALSEYHDCFSDVKKEWFAPYVCYAKDKNLIGGYADGTFKPSKQVNTVEAIKMIVNIYGYQLMQTSSVASYSDVDPSAWYAPYVNLARSVGILETGKTLGVSAFISRGKVSGMVYRSLKSRDVQSVHSAADILKKILPSKRRGGGGMGQPQTPSSQSTSSQIILSSPTLGTFSNVNKYLGDIPFTLTPPSSNSAGTFSYVSSNTGVATVAGSTVTLVSNGTSTITATQAANGNFTTGTKTMTLTVYFGGCISEPCLNGGTCTNEPGGAYSCACVGIFSGTTCEMDDSNCAADGDYACLNGGTCIPNAAHGECSCAECFMGSQCELFNAGACA